MTKELTLLWDRMLPITKTKALSALVADSSFSVSNIDYARRKWILGDKMPKDKVSEVKIIFRMALFEEFVEIKTILETV